ncbi:hypothetical protein QVD17_41737 [Tagetes erecta]|uniref:Transposase-associated domain-containing protein n=1 Tax=Tagetes erecta TaxID=13708 RepID=A0AAD8JN25_TARER|nr:hypothetical protein QVD17_41737 [Tagetes erecta]
MNAGANDGDEDGEGDEKQHHFQLKIKLKIEDVRAYNQRIIDDVEKEMGLTSTLSNMEWFTNRQWMKKKTNSDGYCNMKYCENVNLFLDFAYSNETTIDRRVTKHGKIVYEIKCPCFKCQNAFYSRREKVQKHLLKNAFMDNYTTWHAHGETSIHEVGQSSNTMEVDAADDDDDNAYRRMVLDSMHPSDYNPTQQLNLESNNLEVHAPNPEAKGFYDMLEAADELLWEGEKATDFKKLEAATNFLNWKSMFNVSTACYNHNISMVKALLPKENKLPENFYDTKKSLEKLSLPKERIDVCKNHCMLNREPRNFAPDILCSSSTDTRLSIFKHPSRRLSRGKPILPTDKDRLKAHTYTLLNCQELHDFVILYDEEQRALFPDCEKAILDEKKDEGFARWLQIYVLDNPVNSHVRDVAQAEDDNIVGDDDDEEDTEHFFQENERLTCASTEDLFYVTHVETNVIKEVDDMNDGDQEEEEAAFECIDSDEDADEFEDEDTD